MTAGSVATRTSSTRPVAQAGGFRWYRDEQLTDGTPYNSDNRYFNKARDRIDRTVDLIREALPGSTVVDVGASPFYLLYRVLELGAKRAFGIYFANDDHPLRGLGTIYSTVGSVELLHRNIENDLLPLADDSIDVLTACEVLEHLEYFPLRFAREVRRIVRPGGFVCFTVPNSASIGNILKLVFQKNIFMPYRSDPTGRHKHEYTLAELRALVRFLGLDLVRIGVLPSTTSEKTWLRPAYRTIAKTPGLRCYSPVLYAIGRQPAEKRTEWLGLPPLLYSEDLSLEL